MAPVGAEEPAASSGGIVKLIDLWPTKDAAETGAGSEAQCYAASRAPTRAL